MAFRPPNYRQQRGDRDRAKQQKRKERLARREADAEQRRAEREALLGADSGRDAQSTETDAQEAPASDAPSEND